MGDSNYCDGLCGTPVVFRWLVENRDGFYIFFAVGCASGSYVEWFFVGSGAGEGSFTVFCFLYNYLYFFCMFLLSKIGFP